MSRLEPILNLSSTESDEDSHDREPCPPSGPIFRQQKHLRRPIRPRKLKVLKGSVPLLSNEAPSDDDSSSIVKCKAARESVKWKPSARNEELEDFQQHFIRLQEQSLQLLESAFEEIEDLKSQRRDLTIALHERDSQILSLSADIESFHCARSKEDHGSSFGSNPVILGTSPMSCHKKSPSRNPELSVSKLIAIYKRHFFLNMVTTMEQETKSSLVAFIAQKAQCRRKKAVILSRHDPIVARLDSDGLEALRLPDRLPRSCGRLKDNLLRDK